MENLPPLPEDAQPPQPAPAPAPGGFWLRAGAYMIDGMITGIPGAVISGLATAVGIPGAAGSLLGMCVSIAYFTYMPVAYNGQTLGKMAAGLAITRLDGSGLTYGRAFGRWVGYYISSLPVFLGFLTAVFTDKKRALHDFIADTRVVVVSEIGTLRRIAVIGMGLLIPLALVLGIAAAIAIPKFADLANKSNEGATKANLGALRAALSIYYGDMLGVYPDSLEALTSDGRYIMTIPSAKTPPHHDDSSQVSIYGAEACTQNGDLSAAAVTDTGGWGYVSAPGSICHDMLFVNCTHEDSRLTQWHTY